MPTITTTNSRITQHSPLLTLPPEIRLMIYPYALTHTVDEAKAQNFTPAYPVLRGALALLHTSSLLRTESSDALRSLAQLERFKIRRDPQWADLSPRFKAAIDERKWSEALEMGERTRFVRGFVEGVCGNVFGEGEG